MNDEDKIQADFDRLMAEQPAIYQRFADHALKLAAMGFAHYSAKGILEVMRWETDIREGPDARLKLNNNYTSRLARLFEERNPAYAGFFHKRKLRPASANSTHRADDYFGAQP